MNNSLQITIHLFFILFAIQASASENPLISFEIELENCFDKKTKELANSFWDDIEKEMKDEVDRKFKTQKTYICNESLQKSWQHEEKKQLYNQKLNDLSIQHFGTTSCSPFGTTDNEATSPCSNISLDDSYLGKRSVDQWEDLIKFRQQKNQAKNLIYKPNSQSKK